MTIHRKPLYLALCAGLLIYPLYGFPQHSLPSLGEDGNADEYDLTITRVDDQGPDQFVEEDVTVGAGANARLEFDNWDGENGTVNWQEDEDGDGFDDEEVNSLENARSKRTP